METPHIILEARRVSCSRSANAGPLAPVREVSLAIRAGTLTLLAGDGQGGENLLLRLFGLLESPDAGEILYRGSATTALSGEHRAELRNQRFGFVFPEPFLLPSFSVVENVAMPLFKISAVGADEARKRTEAALEFVGVESVGNAPIGGLTPAQEQRVSLARALVNQPEILIVENADVKMEAGEAAAFIDLVRRANAEFGTTVILTARARGALKSACRVVELVGGVIVRDSENAIGTGGAAA